MLSRCPVELYSNGGRGLKLLMLSCVTQAALMDFYFYTRFIPALRQRASQGQRFDLYGQSSPHLNLCWLRLQPQSRKACPYVRALFSACFRGGGGWRLRGGSKEMRGKWSEMKEEKWGLSLKMLIEDERSERRSENIS